MANQKREVKKQRSQQAKAAKLAAQRRRRNTRVAAIIAVLVVVFVGVGSFVNSGSGGGSGSSTTNDSTTDSTTAIKAVAAGQVIKGDTPCPPATGATERASQFEKAPPMCIDPAKTYTANFDTSEGHIVTTLDTKKTPNTTNNFVVLSRYKYYDGSAIFRTDTEIDVLQGGSPNTQDNSDPGPGYTINDESDGFKYTEGDLVMARTGSPNSASAQYFFAAGPNTSKLDQQGTYVTFGHVTQGLDVVKKILSYDAGGKPNRTVVVNNITITES